MSDEVFQRSDSFLERPEVETESSGRDWVGIGIGLAAAFALVAIFVAGMWALVVLVEALA